MHSKFKNTGNKLRVCHWPEIVKIEKRKKGSKKQINERC